METSQRLKPHSNRGIDRSTKSAAPPKIDCFSAACQGVPGPKPREKTRIRRAAEAPLFHQDHRENPQGLKPDLKGALTPA